MHSASQPFLPKLLNLRTESSKNVDADNKNIQLLKVFPFDLY